MNKPESTCQICKKKAHYKIEIGTKLVECDSCGIYCITSDAEKQLSRPHNTNDIERFQKELKKRQVIEGATAIVSINAKGNLSFQDTKLCH